MTTYIGFTGHRNRITDPAELDRIAAQYPGAIWIHGGAAGFDTQVEQCAKAHKIWTIVLRPDYELYRAVPKQAPLQRNRTIVDRCSLLVACWDGRKHGGTYYTVKYAMEREKPVYQVEAKRP